MTEDRFPKKILEWVPPGRRRGRPRITWIDGVLSCMREKGLEEGDWSDRPVEKNDSRSIGRRKM